MYIIIQALNIHNSPFISVCQLTYVSWQHEQIRGSLVPRPLLAASENDIRFMCVHVFMKEREREIERDLSVMPLGGVKQSVP